MRFTLSSTALCGKLTALAKVINPKNSLPILGDVVFKTEGTTLRLTASDGENTMITTAPLNESDCDLTFAVVATSILEAVKSLAEQPITMEVDSESSLLKISYLNGQFCLPIENTEEFPVMQGVEDGGSSEIRIKSSLLAENIKRSLFATAVDTLRPVMTGIYFDLKPEGLTTVASDGHKLVRTTMAGIKTGETKSFILPKKPATLLNALLGSSSEEETAIKFNDNKAQITFGDTVIICTLIEGKYPNYSAVIPKSNDNEITIDRLSLLGALKRVTPFANNASNLIRFKIDNGKLVLNAEDLDFSKTANEQIACEYVGSPMCIGFKGQAFVDVLNNFSCDTVIIKLADPSRAGLVIPSEQPDGQDVLMLLMPMLISD